MIESLLYLSVVLAALAHAVWNALVKGSSDKFLTMVWIRIVGLVFGMVAFMFVGPPARESWPFLGAAVVAHYFYYGLLIRSYDLGDLSHVYPIARGLGPALLAVGAFLFVGETLSTLQFACLALICLGILFLASQAGSHKPATAFAIATGISISAYTLLGGLGVRLSGSVLAFQACLEILTGVGMLGAGVVVKGEELLKFAKSKGKVATLAGLISVLGYLAFLNAVTILPLGPTSAVRESSVIFGAILGALFLKEPFGFRRISAAVFVGAGIVGLAALR